MKCWFPTLFGALRAAWGQKKTTPRRSPGRFKPALDLLEDRLQPSVSLGAAGTFAVLGINGGRVTLNNAKITGDIGLGPREAITIQRTSDTGKLIADPTATLPRRLAKNVSITGGVVRQDLSQAVADANAASTAFAALTPTQTLGRVTRSFTVSGNGDVNVINVRALNFTARTITLSGGANDQFVFNVAAAFTFHRSKINLVGGVTADHVIFNFPTAGARIDVANRASSFSGTVLAPWRRVDYSNPAAFHGAIIARNINVHSGGNVSYVGFTPPVASTTPATLSGHVDGMSGVRITLRDASNTIVQQVFTDSSGFYQMTSIAPGTYSLSASKSDYDPISATAGTADGIPNGTSGSSKITNIVLGFGDVAIDYDFELEPTESNS